MRWDGSWNKKTACYCLVFSRSSTWAPGPVQTPWPEDGGGRSHVLGDVGTMLPEGCVSLEEVPLSPGSSAQ